MCDRVTMAYTLCTIKFATLFQTVSRVFFGRFLAEHRNLLCKVWLLSRCVVCRLSLTRVYCEKLDEARITLLSLTNSKMSQLLAWLVS